MAILSTILQIIQVIISLIFIALVAVQTGKNEGLTGTVGAPVSSNFKGKPGFDDQLQHYTKVLAISWVVICIISAIINGRIHP